VVDKPAALSGGGNPYLAAFLDKRPRPPGDVATTSGVSALAGADELGGN